MWPSAALPSSRRDTRSQQQRAADSVFTETLHASPNPQPREGRTGRAGPLRSYSACFHPFSYHQGVLVPTVLGDTPSLGESNDCARMVASRMRLRAPREAVATSPVTSSPGDARGASSCKLFPAVGFSYKNNAHVVKNQNNTNMYQRKVKVMCPMCMACLHSIYNWILWKKLFFGSCGKIYMA